MCAYEKQLLQLSLFDHSPGCDGQAFSDYAEELFRSALSSWMLFTCHSCTFAAPPAKVLAGHDKQELRPRKALAVFLHVGISRAGDCFACLSRCVP